LNQGPLGYEPNELPDCSTPHLDSNNRSPQGQTVKPQRRLLRRRRFQAVPGSHRHAKITGPSGAFARSFRTNTTFERSFRDRDLTIQRVE
jgi:hypothetical protein